MNRVRRGTGRVQFLAHKREIGERLDAGETGRLIYDDLSQGDKPKLTLSYRQFMKYIEKEFGEPKESTTISKSNPLTPPKTGVQKGGVKRVDFGDAEKKFEHRPKANDDELI